MTEDGPRVLVTASELQEGVARLGAEVSTAYPDGVLVVAVLKGSVLFLADLVRRVTVPVEIDFLAISSYAEGTGRVRIVKDLDVDIGGRNVVVVEDVVDTGLTLTYLLGVLERRGPRSLAVCTLLDRRAQRIVPLAPRFVGFEVADEFVIGYGLDFAERYRNVEAVVVADVATLRDDADAYVNAFFQG
ncbi:MAG TPA: hypoxanthine phosphoribosyltransferase [Acidimicrobiales bacterium]|nr:hypoxanthine phosphoribosyltransferase [Acidimicrobiales bacterium]